MTRQVCSPRLAPVYLLALSLGAVVSCTQKREPQRKRPDGGATTVVETRLVVTPARLDLGTVTQNELVSLRASVKNGSSSRVRLQPIEANRTCNGVVNPDTIEPGAVADLSVTCRADLQGPLKETLLLRAAAPAQGEVPVEIVAKVQPVVGFDTQFVEFNLAFGETKTKDVRVIGKLVKTAKLTVKETGSSLVTAVALPVVNGEAPAYRLRCKGSLVGMHAGSLVLTTGISEQPEISVSWGCKVPGTLEVNPTNPYFNLKVSGDKATTIEVKSRQPDFELLSARITEGPFAAKVEPRNGEETYRIVITVMNARIPDDARAATGKLLIISNDRTEPRKEVPLFGFGLVNKVERPD